MGTQGLVLWARILYLRAAATYAAPHILCDLVEKELTINESIHR